MKRKFYYLFKLNGFIINLLPVLILVFMTLITYNVFDYEYLSIVLENDVNYFSFFFLILLYCILHEIIHGLSYFINGAKFKNITFGIMLEKGILYCLCKQNISKRNILISSIAPLILIGFVTYFIGIYFNLPLLVLLSIFNMSGCSGDIVTFMFISRLKDVQFSEFDDPICFALYSSNDLSKYKPFGLKYVGKKDDIKRSDFRKVVVSVISIFILLFLLIISFN